MTRVRLTFEARQRFPDIATGHGTATGTTAGSLNGWRRVEWPGERTTWLRDEDIEPVQDEETDISKN